MTPLLKPRSLLIYVSLLIAFVLASSQDPSQCLSVDPQVQEPILGTNQPGVAPEACRRSLVHQAVLVTFSEDGYADSVSDVLASLQDRPPPQHADAKLGTNSSDRASCAFPSRPELAQSPHCQGSLPADLPSYARSLFDTTVATNSSSTGTSSLREALAQRIILLYAKVANVRLNRTRTSKTHDSAQDSSVSAMDFRNQSTQASSFWIEQVDHNGAASFNPSPNSYKVFRNVKDYGAVGDGVTDDTNAINLAISFGSRCGPGCESATVSPALVYFPPGVYLISSPLLSYYYTQLVGSATDPPTLLASSTFQGIAVIDEDPYLPGGANWYINQNNFFRAVYNFVIDLTQMPPSSGTGIHHQVSQATGLFNVHFRMRTDDGNQQQGIFMENGSGGFMANLSFYGGRYGAVLGNQQFTFRDSVFEGCNTAINQVWSWGWTYSDLRIKNCKVAMELRTIAGANSGGDQGAASSLITDWTIENTQLAFNLTAQDSGVLILDNVQISNVPDVVRSGGQTILEGSSSSKTISSWVQGPVYLGDGTLQRIQGPLETEPARPESLIRKGDPRKRWFQRNRPQYTDEDASEFVNVKDFGCAGDGETDDTAMLQAILDQCAGSKIIFVPHGTYMLYDTLFVPPGTRMVGEAWPVLMGAGPSFQNPSSPRPVVQVGKKGDTGVLEISDMVFSTRGPAPGAIVVEWNMREDASIQGSAGMWDSHIRIGGFAGTQLEADKCAREAPLSDDCRASFLNLHLTKTSSAYLENVWIWTADHDLDYGERAQINILSGRGVLIESADGPVWMYGTASEHSVLYQYNIVNASNVLVMLAQIETAYYQGQGRETASETEALELTTYHDPDLAKQTNESSPISNPQDPYENRGVGLRIAACTNTLIYGAGLYSFFDNYSQDCIPSRTCQKRITWVQNLSNDSNVWILNLNTVGTEKMLTVDDLDLIDERSLRNGFSNTLAVWTADKRSN